MQTRILKVVDAGRRRNRAHVSDMLHHCGEGNRENGDYGSHDKTPVRILEHGETGVLPLERQADPCGLLDRSEIHLTEAGGDNIRAEDTEQDRHDLDHPAAPDVADDDDGHREDGDPPVLVAVLDGRARERESDCDDDRSRHYRREETHHLLGAESGEEPRKDEIHEPRAEHAYAGIRKRLGEGHPLGHTHLGHSGITAEEREG